MTDRDAVLPGETGSRLVRREHDTLTLAVHEAVLDARGDHPIADA